MSTPSNIAASTSTTTFPIWKEGRVIVEIKTADAITDEHVGQVINYLRITGHKAGVILNFKHSKSEWKKVVLTEPNS